MRDAAVSAEAAGWDSVWVWDHLMSIIGPDDQPILEGWTALAAIAALTSRVRVGLMVGANTFRNPGLTAKLATTLDHVSGGRAVLGLGGAWFEREHEAFGIEFGASVGARLDWL
ncbi:MAG TPA: LLM class flavin-dependent oxidoreductase, partial [Candidatus Binatus sp.]|nr:LLM class flavin-dependent oxidoreductase [Candidatus Binatus sp.]